MDKGSIHIYCGEGKGKTTAAIGQGIQEASQGRSVIIIQFMKERNAEEIGFVQRLEPEIKLFRFQKSEEAFEQLPDAEKAEEIKNLKNALNFARKVLVTEECDVLILDEVLGLVGAGVIEAEELLALFEAKGEYTSLILTGIYPAKEIWQYADEVTEMVTAYKAGSSGIFYAEIKKSTRQLTIYFDNDKITNKSVSARGSTCVPV